MSTSTFISVSMMRKFRTLFFSNCLPITWADKNIDIDFNPRAFVNLLDYAKNSYERLYLIN